MAVGRIRAAFEGLRLPPGFSVVFGDAYREQQESQRDFTIAIILALAPVYMVMAARRVPCGRRALRVCSAAVSQVAGIRSHLFFRVISRRHPSAFDDSRSYPEQ